MIKTVKSNDNYTKLLSEIKFEKPQKPTLSKMNEIELPQYRKITGAKPVRELNNWAIR
ncbi:hypothetical protein QA584_15675 [Anaerocolumna sp. AGMB13025]|uniref:hypothetical protein n=1 Tax=Anaerocolumna sp. AGMB13025 TaxID=3039116 RepID=UPI00241DFF68|nr:hypothetical protein [Anaerocolumna sp. AGMB13025]WFR55050.1 hypothetical protein QA584_15675 [Anaerocolumna sp. AGMB13025]